MTLIGERIWNQLYLDGTEHEKKQRIIALLSFTFFSLSIHRIEKQTLYKL
jgi:hypothetical protein